MKLRSISVFGTHIATRGTQPAHCVLVLFHVDDETVFADAQLERQFRAAEILVDEGFEVVSEVQICAYPINLPAL